MDDQPVTRITKLRKIPGYEIPDRVPETKIFSVVPSWQTIPQQGIYQNNPNSYRIKIYSLETLDPTQNFEKLVIQCDFKSKFQPNIPKPAIQGHKKPRN
jgi:hypothetical protein